VNDQNAPMPNRTEAAVRRSRWPGWIWAVPIAAFLVVGWWAVRWLTQGGADITISFDDSHGMKENSTAVVYRGVKVGKVSDIALAKDAGSVEVSVHVDDSVKAMLTTGTQFWLRGAQPDFSDLSSLGAIVSGPTIVMAPGPGDATRRFAGLAYAPIIAGARGAPQIYGVALNGDAGQLSSGAPVKLRGFTVGEVRDVGFRYDAGSSKVTTPVTLALYPALFHLGRASDAADAALAQAMQRLVAGGLEARLARDPPVIGTAQVALEIMPSAAGATLTSADGVPQIPAASEGGVSSIVERVGKLPIEQIGQNILDVTQHAKAIAASPALNDAVSELDATLKQIHDVAANAAPQIGPLADELRRTANRLDAVANSAEQMMSGSTSQSNTQQTMREITEAARSVRDLATYLDRHPEAIIKGRSGE
jgi:paraquat-inducible protein B